MIFRREITMQDLSALELPQGMLDVILDTDTYNEIDDQFALTYLLRSDERLICKAITAAPFFNSLSTSPEDGMEKSYDEILKVLNLCGRNDLVPSVFKGSRTYLKSETDPIISPAAEKIVEISRSYSPERRLYVVAIGAITNVASAILMDKSIIDRIVVVWLGGHALHWKDNKEFNLHQDIAAARVIFGCGVPLVQLPCCGVVSAFSLSKPEIEAWLLGANPICDYLGRNTIEYEERHGKDRPWSKTIWDVTAVAWLLNEGCRFMEERIIHAPIPEYDGHYSLSEHTHFMKYIWHIKRTALFEDLFKKLKK